MSKQSEWYTPEWLVRMCEEAMDIEQFDVDLYSCDKAQETVRARKYHTKDRPAKSLRLSDYAFCNPPSGLIQDAWDGVTLYTNFCWIGFNWAHVHSLCRKSPLTPVDFYTLILPSRIRFVPGAGQKESSPRHDNYITFGLRHHAVAFANLYGDKFGKVAVLLDDPGPGTL